MNYLEFGRVNIALTFLGYPFKERILNYHGIFDKKKDNDTYGFSDSRCLIA